jgi:hypothetical protein
MLPELCLYAMLAEWIVTHPVRYAKASDVVLEDYEEQSLIQAAYFHRYPGQLVHRVFRKHCATLSTCSCCEQHGSDIVERLEFQSIAARVEEKHRRLFARESLKTDVRLNQELHAGKL